MKVCKLVLLPLLLFSATLFAKQLVLGAHRFSDSTDFYLKNDVALDFQQLLSSGEKKWLEEHNEIRVGVVGPITPPFGLITSKNNFEGISADIISILSDITGRKFSLYYFPSPKEALAAIKEQRIDMLSINSILPVTEPYLDKYGWFSQEVLKSGQAYLIGMPDSEPSLTVRPHPVLAFEERSFDIKMLRQLYPNAKLVPYASAYYAFDAVLFGEADFFVGSRLVARYLNGTRFGNLSLLQRLAVDNKPLSFFVGIENPQLLRILNSFVSVFQANGLYSFLDLRWRGGMGTEQLTLAKVIKPENYKKLVSENIRVGLIKDNVPFSFINDRGQWQGIIIDVLNHISLQTGLRFTEVSYDAFDEAEYGLINNQVDIIGSISSHITRSDLLSSLYYNADDTLVTIMATDLPMRHYPKNTYAVSRANHSEVKNSHLFDSPNNKFIFFETDLEAIKQLESGVVDKAIVSLYTAEYYRSIASRGYKVSGRLNNESVERVFSVRSDSGGLLQLVNETLANSLPSYLSSMAYRWRYGPKPNLSFYAQYGNVIRPLLVIVLPCLLIYFYYSYRLARALKYRKKAESRLFSQLDIMQRFIDGIPHPVVLLQDDMTIIYRNRAFSEAFSHEITNSSKHLSSYILDSADLHRIYGCISEALKLSDVLDHEVSISIDGKRRDIQDWFIPYKDLHDNSVGVFWGWFDVTWRNEAYANVVAAKQEAESANQAKSEFIATISHELRTPINIISGFLEIFYKTRILTDSEREELDFVRTAADGLLELVGDVLDVTKIESGLLHLELEATDITRLLQDAVSMFKVTAQEKGVVIYDNFNAVLPDLMMLDPVRVRQVFYNILSNAVKFTSKGSIFVETQLNDDVLVVSVIDSGIGISEDKIDILFQPFRQAHVNRHYQGAGLGLNITKRLCELMGGSISLQSTLGVGTTIKVTLPCRWADADVSTAVMEKRDTPRDVDIEHTNLRIIIVDDHPVNLILLGKQLRLLGFTVIQAATGKEVLDLLREESVDVILTDCQMPEMDGYDLTKRIRSYEQEVQCLPHTIIGITASGLKQDRERAIEAGMNECIFKPIDTDGLKKTLNIQLCQVIKTSEKATPTHQDNKLNLLILDTTKQDLSLSFECLLKDDYEQLSSLVHRIKGVYLMVRNPQVVTLCKEIETALEQKRDTGFISEKLHEIERLIEVS